MKLPDKVYDKLKWIIIMVMPAAATAIIAYGELYGWDAATVVAKSIIIAQTFLGAIFAVSAVRYHATEKDGQTIIEPVEDDQEGE